MVTFCLSVIGQFRKSLSRGLSSTANIHSLFPRIRSRGPPKGRPPKHIHSRAPRTRGAERPTLVACEGWADWRGLKGDRGAVRRFATVARVSNRKAPSGQIEKNKTGEVRVPPIKTTNANNSFMGYASA
eukprot:3352296-Pyramimonas_sp.AAC.1